MLSQKKLAVSDRDFFKIPFTRSELEVLLQGRPASELFNFRSPSFRKLGAERDTLSEADLLELMLKEPRLIRRPVVRIGRKVYFGADRKVLNEIIR